MRALLSTIGTRGDVQPLVALAEALRELGHESRLCVPPDFAGWVRSLGFRVTTVGPPLRTPPATPTPDIAAPPTAEQRRALAEASVAGQFEALDDAVRGCDVLVAATALQIGARSVAEAAGIPYVFVAYSPVVLPSTGHAPPSIPEGTVEDVAALWARDAALFDAMFGEALDAHRAAPGPAVRRGRARPRPR
ncbi:glycosyltransferase [Actinomarinicola tropica]|uniref:glycosyltransferase n=1 Tax=Actinomarinicola tropica TaxID=2789776 RepID=UPI001E5501E9|nr:glycosyltransferase [Actinomarinicola tropica]